MAQTSFSLRAATAKDQGQIFGLVWRSRINPRGIRWQNFVIAQDTNGRLLGIGQIKTHRLGTRELASIATEPGARGQGIAGAIIKYLIASQPGPLYLFCEGTLVPFYARFGFAEVPDAEIPGDLLAQIRIGRVATRLAQALGSTLRLAVMRLPA